MDPFLSTIYLRSGLWASCVRARVRTRVLCFGLALDVAISLWQLVRTGLWREDGLKNFANWHQLVDEDEILLPVDNALGGWPKQQVVMMKIVRCDATPEPEPGRAGEGDASAGVRGDSDSSDTSD